MTCKVLCFLLLGNLLFFSQVLTAAPPAGPTKIVRKFKKPAKLVDISPLNKEYSGKDGFMIITTNDLTHQLKSLQKYISHKKNFRKFNVFVATENDYVAGSKVEVESKKRGAAPGRVIAKGILNFLRTNYKKLNLKYVLFIGDGRPEYGTTPMLRISHHKKIKNGIKKDSDEYRSSDDEPRELEEDSKSKCVYDKATGKFTEYGSVISDYPYIDLDTDWDANNDGFLDPADDKNREHTREPEVFVGRVLYYGEDSSYAKAEDVDIILKRFIRYDREKNIAWRYNAMVEAGKDGQFEKIDFLEKNRINYKLFSRHKAKAIGMPSINSRNGGENIPNFQIIQDHSVGVYGNHSHGGPYGMEGLSSKHIAANAHDRWPTVLTLGACYIGSVNHPNNLIYTLLRFQSVAASGGTGGVTTYGGNKKYVNENKLGKGDLLWQGKSVGEAHWGWYGALFKKSRGVPSMTTCKINLYGDPSVIPFRYGTKPPYSFFADPIMGKIGCYDIESKSTKDYLDVTLTNNRKQPVTIYIKSDKSWLRTKTPKVILKPSGSQKVRFVVSNSRIALDSPTDKGLFYRSLIKFTDKRNGYETTRPFVLKRVSLGLKNVYDFESENDSVHDLLSNKHVKVSFGKSYSKLTEENKAEKLFADGYRGRGLSLATYPPAINSYLTENESFTMSFWLKMNSATKVDIFSSSFLSFSKKGKQFSGTLRNYRGDVAKSFDFNTDKDYADGKWRNYIFSLNQKSGTMSVYINAELQATVQTKPNQLYGAQKIQFGKMNAVIDNFMLYNLSKSEKSVLNLAKGNIIAPITPALNAEFVPNKKVAFKTLAGSGIKSSYLVVEDLVEKSRVKVDAGDNGEFIVPKLAPFHKCRWYVVGETQKNQSVRSKPQLFSTVPELLENGALDGEEVNWEGQYTLEKPNKKSGFTSNKIKLNGTGNVVIKIPNALDKKKAYIFSADGVIGPAITSMKIVASAKDASGKLIPIAETMLPKYAKPELKFKAPATVSRGYLIIELSQQGRPDQKPRKKQSYFDNFSLVAVSPSKINFSPMLTAAYKKTSFTAKVGTAGYAVNLDELIRDPERGALTYEKVKGPDWANIQANDLFSPFGPKTEDRGTIGEFLISAADNAGNRTMFKINIQVK